MSAPAVKKIKEAFVAEPAHSGGASFCGSACSRHLANPAQSLERAIDCDADRAVATPPAPLPSAAAWPALDQADNEYRRVAFRAEFETAKEAFIFAAPSAFRPDVKGQGFWIFTPARLVDGRVVVVNRGFAPVSEAKALPSRPNPGIVEIAGTIRWPEARIGSRPRPTRLKTFGSVRDPAQIAAVKGWGPVAPFYVEQESPAPPGGWPQPGKLVPSLPDNHLQYAVTWYGLALVLACSSSSGW